MLLTEDKAEEILNSRLDSVTFSVDGASSGTYENIRIGLKYETIKKNILSFFEKKRS